MSSLLTLGFEPLVQDVTYLGLDAKKINKIKFMYSVKATKI